MNKVIKITIIAIISLLVIYLSINWFAWAQQKDGFKFQYCHWMGGGFERPYKNNQDFERVVVPTEHCHWFFKIAHFH